jgi:hypothetical protein
MLVESLKVFDKDLISKAASRSYKKSKVKVHSLFDRRVPRESVYETELIRILTNWLTKSGWTVTGQWHLRDGDMRNKYFDIVIKRTDYETILLELLATGEPKFVESHIQKTPEYMALLSASTAWVIHFTCEMNYTPIWQSSDLLSRGINVVHFSHNFEFTEVQMSACWKDCRGNIKQSLDELLAL